MSLQYNVSQLLKSDIGSVRSYDFEDDKPLDLDGAVATDISGHVKFTLTNFGIVAAIAAHALLHLTCARCLEPFQTPVDVAFEEEYQPEIDIVSGLPSTTPRSDTASSISANHTLDLRAAIRENVLLAVEMIPLCTPECRGLCANCGTNLNIETCNCPPAEEPSPFAVLQGLLGGVQQEK
jgi:uncharacterized protein